MQYFWVNLLPVNITHCHLQKTPNNNKPKCFSLKFFNMFRHTTAFSFTIWIIKLWHNLLKLTQKNVEEPGILNSYELG